MPIMTKVPRRERKSQKTNNQKRKNRDSWLLHPLPLSSEICLKMFSEAGPLQTSAHSFFCPLPSVDREH